MKQRWLVGFVLAVFVFALAAPAAAAGGDKIVRTKSGLDGLKVINSVCRLLGCQVLRSLDVLPGESQSGSLFLVRGLLDNTVNFLLSLLGLATIEPDLLVEIVPEDDWNEQQASSHVVDQLWDQSPMDYYGSTAWRSYLVQPASEIVRLPEAHCSLRATGAGTVAVIDTGVDPEHPTLKPVLTPGYDFLRNSSVVSELLGQTLSSLAEAGVVWVNPSTAAVVNQASSHVVDDPSHSAYGHGTMVAGVVHLVAPTARIMPLRAFGPDGKGRTSDLLRAVYYATNKGAKVINMSFSRATWSRELKLALDYASARGVILVGSAGNDGIATLAYPAAYNNVIGVASTTNDDLRSEFSNYGSRLVKLAAPGQGIITPFPGGGFAAATGTSFSTPIVSGAAALLVGLKGNASAGQVVYALSHAKRLVPELGYGRADLYQAVLAGRAMWSSGASSAVPQSCASHGEDWSGVQ
jgi:subtilisin family serine protease